MTEHRLVDDTLVREKDGIVARCVCGWKSRGHFSSMSASSDFQDHKEREAEKLIPQLDPQVTEQIGEMLKKKDE